MHRAVALRHQPSSTDIHVFPDLDLNLEILKSPVARVYDKLGQDFFVKRWHSNYGL